MMGAKVTITFQGLEQVIDNLTTLEDQAPKNLERQVAKLADDTEQEWKDVTPKRTGRLQGEEYAAADGLSFTLNNTTKYYPFVNDGHMTPKGWRTKHGYRPAKRRSHVEGQEMTEKAVEFIEKNIEEYLSKFLE